MTARETILRLWDDWGQVGVKRFGFPVGSIRQAMLVATAVCWLLAAVLIVVGQ